MDGHQVFTSRLRGRPLLDVDGHPLGRIRDVVIRPAVGGMAPRAVGLVAAVQRRQIFVNLGRVSKLGLDGAHLVGGTVDLRHFTRREEEQLASELYNRPLDDDMILDVSIVPAHETQTGWEVAALALGSQRTLRRRVTAIVPWTKHPELFTGGPMAQQLAELRDLHPTDLAEAVETMSPSRRRQLADSLQDEELADVLQEMSEPDQIRFLAGLDVERRADVIEEMEPDDAADVLGEMPAEQREVVLAAMETVQAAEVRRLLRYDARTAGGLMTSQPVVVTPDSSVAEVLATIRNRELAAISAATVYVCEPPTETPTGRFLGTVGFQRLLRHPPSARVGEFLQVGQFVRPDLPEAQVASRLAAYNLLGVAVCDEAGRLVGAVTVDDILDRMLPAGWRRRRS